jgi:hypothetical protein
VWGGIEALAVSTRAPEAPAKGTGLVLGTLAAGQFLMTLDSSVMNVSIATVEAASPDNGATVKASHQDMCNGLVAPRVGHRSHVIDVAPTVLEAAGLPKATFVNGVQVSASVSPSIGAVGGWSVRFPGDRGVAAGPEAGVAPVPWTRWLGRGCC